MIQDPNDRYIATILSQCELRGKELLELGCGKGRITRDLARYAGHVLACDPDSDALEAAKRNVAAANVEFRWTPTGLPEALPGSFDLALYTLSLHHVPEAEMSASLNQVTGMLRSDGTIVVIEPGDSGSFTEAKERFGAGSGDERPARAAAMAALNSVPGWKPCATILFRTTFQFDDEDDFLATMLPGYREQPASFVEEVRQFLAPHRGITGIVLDAERRFTLLRRH